MEPAVSLLLLLSFTFCGVTAKDPLVGFVCGMTVGAQIMALLSKLYKRGP